MQNLFENYIHSISTKYTHTETSEMGYRTDFELLLKGIFHQIKVGRIDHDARTKDGNKPDFVVLDGEVPILYVEAKDIGVSLDKVEKSEQMARYFGYANLILTDYVEFRFYRNGVQYGEPIKIAEFDSKTRKITPFTQNYELVAKTLIDFSQSHKESIKSGNHLAKIMGGKAQRIRDNVRHFLSIESEQNQEILRVYETIKRMLVHDLDLDAFSDMYSQTLVYGLFVARYYDESPDNFSRQEARDLVPASNPFLRHFFDHIAGPNFDKRLSYIVDELCLVFQHADIRELIENYMGDADPVIHFYEDFLKEYDPDLRKKMGAYYTPLPVVRFIVNSIDSILKNSFNLSGGLADTSKLLNGQHRVQILDPAVGTGTFISATIRSIYESLKKSGQEGRWPSYVHNDLLPRLHGFELMMAPYTIAHLKLSLAFKKTGFWKFHRRLGIYLTNSLEKSSEQQELISFGFAESIAEEAKEADRIKNETPIMVVLGNPPYSVSSSNKGEWIGKLVNDYKVGLKERNIQPLSDDYIKFLRFSEHFVEKNKTGIVAMITNNSFLDGIIHRQMRKHLLETFDSVYVLNLHGNSKKKERAIDGGKDENVFDIQQGVSISLFVRTDVDSNKIADVFYYDFYGMRQKKFEFLNSNNLKSINWQKLKLENPYYFFVPKDFRLVDEYKQGFGLDEIFPLNSSGIKTHRDGFVIDFEKNVIEERISDFINLSKSDNEIKAKYNLKNTASFDISRARQEVSDDDIASNVKLITYKPFDERWVYYSPKLIDRDRKEVMQHVLYPNYSLISKRGVDVEGLAFVSNNLFEIRVFSNPGSQGTDYGFPLYVYNSDGTRIPNIDNACFQNIVQKVNKTTPEEIFDYIYGVLYSSSYREKYKEFLKIDFPRIPYPKDLKTFKSLVSLGNELRLLHLMESPKVGHFVTTFPMAGTDKVEKIVYEDGKVFINEGQYFGNVPELAWNFYIGGYQPAQKWLKDRKGRTLTNEEIEHYQKIIVVLVETDRIMKDIDKIRVID